MSIESTVHRAGVWVMLVVGGAFVLVGVLFLVFGRVEPEAGAPRWLCGSHDLVAAVGDGAMMATASMALAGRPLAVRGRCFRGDL